MVVAATSERTIAAPPQQRTTLTTDTHKNEVENANQIKSIRISTSKTCQSAARVTSLHVRPTDEPQYSRTYSSTCVCPTGKFHTPGTPGRYTRFVCCTDCESVRCGKKPKHTLLLLLHQTVGRRSEVKKEFVCAGKGRVVSFARAQLIHFKVTVSLSIHEPLILQ